MKVVSKIPKLKLDIYMCDEGKMFKLNSQNIKMS